MSYASTNIFDLIVSCTIVIGVILKKANPYQIKKMSIR